MINEYNKSDLFRTFQKLDIKKGDSIFLSTSLGMLGKPKTTNKNILLTVSNWILESLEKLIGKYYYQQLIELVQLLMISLQLLNLNYLKMF